MDDTSLLRSLTTTWPCQEPCTVQEVFTRVILGRGPFRGVAQTTPLTLRSYADPHTTLPAPSRS